MSNNSSPARAREPQADSGRAPHRRRRARRGAPRSDPVFQIRRRPMHILDRARPVAPAEQHLPSLGHRFGDRNCLARWIDSDQVAHRVVRAIGAGVRNGGEDEGADTALRQDCTEKAVRCRCFRSMRRRPRRRSSGSATSDPRDSWSRRPAAAGSAIRSIATPNGAPRRARRRRLPRSRPRALRRAAGARRQTGRLGDDGTAARDGAWDGHIGRGNS